MSLSPTSLQRVTRSVLRAAGNRGGQQPQHGKHVHLSPGLAACRAATLRHRLPAQGARRPAPLSGASPVRRVAGGGGAAEGRLPAQCRVRRHGDSGRPCGDVSVPGRGELIGRHNQCLHRNAVVAPHGLLVTCASSVRLALDATAAATQCLLRSPHTLPGAFVHQ